MMRSQAEHSHFGLLANERNNIAVENVTSVGNKDLSNQSERRIQHMKQIRTVLIGLVLLVPIPIALSQTASVNPIIPEHYSLKFSPDIEGKTVGGDERITVHLSQRTYVFDLNVVDLVVESAVIHDAHSIQTAAISADKTKEKVSLTVSNPVGPGEVTIETHYHGTIGDSCCGFYSVTSHGRRYGLVLASARHVFPAFDDVSLKATFDVSAVIKKSESALSNGSLISDVAGPKPGLHTVTFSTSPKMSTYLLTLVIGKFECATGTSDGIPIRVCGPPEDVPRAATAVQAAKSAIHFYDRYFKIQYPFKKLDIVGLPDVPGAMESTACILANETALFEPTSGISDDWLRNLYLGPIAHEIAHQWFGDLVTMQSRRELWLNEGLASWMSYKATEALQPKLNISAEVLSRSQMAMNADALPNVVPVRSLEGPDEITYLKSAAVLNMVEHYVGQKPLRSGINSYLKRYSYNNARTEDLSREIANASGKPVERIVDSFITQPGIPVVSVQTSCSSNEMTASLTQHRYSPEATNSKETLNEKWAIPVCLRSSGHTQCSLLDTSPMALSFARCGAVFANPNAIGYFHVAYAAENIRLLSADAERSMSPIERVNFLNDVWAEALSRKIGIGDFMTAISLFKSDSNPSVWEAIYSDLAYLDRNVISESDRDDFQKWINTTFAVPEMGPEWETVENDHGEDVASKVARIKVAGLLGANPRLVEISQSLINKKGFGEAASSPFLNTAAQVVIAHGEHNQNGYEKLVDLLKSTKDSHNRSQYLYLLAGFRDQKFIDENLQFLASGDLSVEDARKFRDALFENISARTAILNYFVGDWNNVQKRGLVTSGLFHDLSQMCEARNLNALTLAGQSQAISPKWQEPFMQAKSSVSQCVMQRERFEADANEWLRSQKP